MPEQKTPKVFHIASTMVDDECMNDYLHHIGATGWGSDAEDDHSLLVEVAGRTCYRSFGEGLNKNVTRTRKGNANYIGSGILSAKHGSVLEHPTVTLAICDVSRVVTHELVRHRQGTAFSQESGRYIRIDDLSYYHPDALDDRFLGEVFDELWEKGEIDSAVPEEWEVREHWIYEKKEQFVSAMKRIELDLATLERELCLDHLGDFGKKKKLQSAIRRIAPNGMLNNIIMTGNHRAWRHIIATRTHESAEEEIRIVGYMIYNILATRYPAIYQDSEQNFIEGALPSHIPVVSFMNEKV